MALRTNISHDFASSNYPSMETPVFQDPRAPSPTTTATAMASPRPIHYAPSPYLHPEMMHGMASGSTTPLSISAPSPQFLSAETFESLYQAHAHHAHHHRHTSSTSSAPLWGQGQQRGDFNHS